MVTLPVSRALKLFSLENLSFPLLPGVRTGGAASLREALASGSFVGRTSASTSTSGFEPVVCHHGGSECDETDTLYKDREVYVKQKVDLEKVSRLGVKLS